MSHAKFVPIAVISIAGIFPDSHNTTEFWQQLLSGKDFMRDIPNQHTHWLLDNYYDPDPKAPGKTYAKRGAYIPEINFSPLEFGIPPNIIAHTDTTQLLTLVAAKKLLTEVYGDNWKEVDLSETSVILGTAPLKLLAEMNAALQRPIYRNALRESGLPEELVERACQYIDAQYTPWVESTFPGLLSNVVAGRVCNRFNMQGTNCTVDAACAGSLAAITMAIDELQLGRANLCITGGVDLLNDILMFMCFSKTGALSQSNNCCPFADDADGTMLGEAICLFALKRLEDAERDDNKIYAVIRGIGTSSDGRSKSIYAPTPAGQTLALNRAYQVAGYGMETVGLIEAHGTATKAGDLAEFEGLKLALGDKVITDKIALGSVKSQIGHTKSAAGATSLFKMVMALHHKILPATIKVDKPNQKFDIENSPFYINSESRPWVQKKSHARRAGVSSFGFGGSNFHITLEEYCGPGGKPKRSRAFPSELFLMSEETRSELIKKLQQLSQNTLDESNWIYTIHESQKNFNPSNPERLALVVSNPTDFHEKIDYLITHLQKNSGSSLAIPSGIYYAHGKSYKKIAFLFPGQGSQYLYMGRDLAMHFSLCHEIWQQSIDLPLEKNLDEIVFPAPVFGKDEKKALEKNLQSTYWCQPALATTCLAHYELLKAFGITPQATAGHSFGEIVALYAAGVLNDKKSLEQLSCIRSSVMSIEASKKGAMTAVLEDSKKTIEKFNAWNIPLSIANYNSPNQLVFSGELNAIEQFEERLQGEKINFFRLTTSTAFHSPLFQEKSREFSEKIKPISFGSPKIPLFSNTTGKIYPTNPDKIKEIFGNQFSEPIKFTQEICAMYDSGVDLFIEVGPGHILTNLVKDILKDKEYSAINLDSKKQNGVTSLWHALAQLAMTGVALDFSVAWDDYTPITKPEPTSQQTLTVKLNGYNYNRPYPPENGLAAVNPQSSPEKVAETLGPFFQQKIAKEKQPIQEKTVPTEKFSMAAPSMQIDTSQAETPAQTTTPAAPEAPAADTPLKTLMLIIVAEKTGYPVDSLQMNMDLEADLGIDSIKRIEILSSIQEQVPDLPALDPAQMGSLHTLQEISDYILQQMQGSSSKPTTQVLDTKTTHQQPCLLPRHIVTVVECPLPGKEIPYLREGLIEIIADEQGVGSALLAELEKQALNVKLSSEASDQATVIIDLQALKKFSSVAEAIAINRQSFLTLKKISPLLANGGRTYLAVEALNGQFGISGPIAEAQAWASGISGLIKTAAQEWSDTYVKIIDVDINHSSTEQIAQQLREELLQGNDNHTEIGLPTVGKRVTIDIENTKTTNTTSLPIAAKDVVLVTGGAKGITAQCLLALAKNCQSHFVLLGRTTLKDEDATTLSAKTEADLKRVLIEKEKSSGGNIDLKEINKKACHILDNRIIAQNCKALQQAGAQVQYFPVDVQNKEAITQTLQAIHKQWGPITGLIHGAGTLEDKLIVDKTIEQFDKVFNTKVLGLKALLDATANEPLKLILLFSSVAGRFGNIGQCDYAMANEVMNKVADFERQRRGDQCLVKAINWGPWDSGMVTPALKKIFLARGITPIPTDQGIQEFVNELGRASASNAEIILGELFADSIKKITTNSIGTFIIDANTDSCLLDHKIKNSVVLPLCYTLDWFCQFLQNKGLFDHFYHLTEIKVLQGVKLNDFSQKEIFNIKDLTPNKIGLFHGEKLVDTCQFSMEELPIEAIDIGPLDQWPPTIIAQGYKNKLLYHGPAFHVVDTLLGINSQGALATFKKKPQKNNRLQCIPGLLIDGGFQLAGLWLIVFLNKISVPMSIDKFFYVKDSKIHSIITCQIKGEIINNSHCRFDLIFLSEDIPFAMIKGLNLITFEGGGNKA